MDGEQLQQRLVQSAGVIVFLIIGCIWGVHLGDDLHRACPMLPMDVRETPALWWMRFLSGWALGMTPSCLWVLAVHWFFNRKKEPRA
jgi:hypothetical protein